MLCAAKQVYILLPNDQTFWPEIPPANQNLAGDGHQERHEDAISKLPGQKKNITIYTPDLPPSTDSNRRQRRPLSSYSVSHERDRVVGVEFRLTVSPAQSEADRIISGLAGYYP